MDPSLGVVFSSISQKYHSRAILSLQHLSNTHDVFYFEASLSRHRNDSERLYELSTSPRTAYVIEDLQTHRDVRFVL